MRMLNLNTGSIDLLYLKGSYLFLEVNPTGQFSIFEYIPNDLYDIIQNDLGNNIKDIYRYYGENNHKVLDDYIDLLLKRRIAFLSDLYIQLPPLISRTDGEEKFSHAVIELGVKTTIEDFVWYKSVLESLGIWALQIVVKRCMICLLI